MRPSPIALISSRPCYTAAKTRLYGRALASRRRGTVAPCVEFGELGLRHLNDDVPSTERYLRGFPIERDPVPLADLMTGDLSTRYVGADRQLTAAHQTDLAKLTGDHRRMRGA